MEKVADLAGHREEQAAGNVLTPHFGEVHSGAKQSR